MSAAEWIGAIVGIVATLATLAGLVKWLTGTLADAKAAMQVIAAQVGARVDVLVERLDGFIEAVQKNEDRAREHAESVDSRLDDHDDRLRAVEEHSAANRAVCPRLRGETCGASEDA